MRILYVSQYFPPEMGAPAARVYELARHWVQSGHQVTVLTGFPNHPTGVLRPEYRAKFRRLVYRELVEDINVVRTWLIPLPNRRPHERILNYASFCLSSCLTGAFLRRPDIIIATSPQLLTGLTGWWLSKIKRAPFALEVRDLWPESISGSGVGNQGSLLIRSLRALCGFLYRACDHLVVITPAFKREIVKTWGIPSDKISIVQNGVDTELFTSVNSTEKIETQLGIQDKFIVSYIGTHGFAHGLETVLEAAARIEHSIPEILFLFIGEGADKGHLISWVESKGLKNVRFLPQQTREEIPNFIHVSDACLVLLKRDTVFKTVIPTKMLEFMACGRPVILGVDGQAREVLDEARAGIFVEPENATALVQAITKLYHDSDLRRDLGSNGYHFIRERFLREQTAHNYISVLKNVIHN